MAKKALSLICTITLLLGIQSCSWFDEPEAISGVPPVTVDVTPRPLNYSDDFYYDSGLTLAESFSQLSSLRLTICNSIYSAVGRFTGESSWVPVAANNYNLGSDEFLAASYVAEEGPSATAEILFKEAGFENIEISPLDLKNTWSIKTVKKDGYISNTYDYTVMYGEESDSYRFTLEINKIPTLMLAARRIAAGYAVQVWTPEGIYNILANDTKEGRFGFVSNMEGESGNFPEDDIYFNDELVTSTFTTDRAEYTFLLANNTVYISFDGANYAVPVP